MIHVKKSYCLETDEVEEAINRLVEAIWELQQEIIRLRSMTSTPPKRSIKRYAQQKRRARQREKQHLITVNDLLNTPTTDANVHIEQRSDEETN